MAAIEWLAGAEIDVTAGIPTARGSTACMKPQMGLEPGLAKEPHIDSGSTSMRTVERITADRDAQASVRLR
jgi:hypothetical protein